jgi:hypothetical protein
LSVSVPSRTLSQQLNNFTRALSQAADFADRAAHEAEAARCVEEQIAARGASSIHPLQASPIQPDGDASQTLVRKLRLKPSSESCA